MKVAFLPTPSVRRATTEKDDEVFGYQISTHALREEGDELRQAIAIQHILISTHALREEGDSSRRVIFCSSANFYPRPP